MLLWTALIAIALDVAFKVVDHNFLSVDEGSSNSSDSTASYNATTRLRPTQSLYGQNHSLLEQGQHQQKYGQEKQVKRDLDTLNRKYRSLFPPSKLSNRLYRLQNEYDPVLLTMTVKQEICLPGCTDNFPVNGETFETFGTTKDIFTRSLSANLNLTRIYFKTQLWTIIHIGGSMPNTFHLQPVAYPAIFTDSQNLVDFKKPSNYVTSHSNTYNGQREDDEEHPDAKLQSSDIPWNRSWIVRPILNYRLKSEANYIKHGPTLHYEIKTHIPDKCVNVNDQKYIGSCGEAASTWILLDSTTYYNADIQ